MQRISLNIEKNLIAVIFISALSSQVNAQSKEDLKNQLLEITKANQTINENLKTFDTLDYIVFSNRDWKRLHESHAKDIIVHFPDGQNRTAYQNSRCDVCLCS